MTANSGTRYALDVVYITHVSPARSKTLLSIINSLYLCSNLVNDVAAGQIPHFVRISHVDLESRLRSLLYGHAGLCLSLRALRIGGRLYRRRASEATAILRQIDILREPGSASNLREGRGWLRATSSKQFLLRRCRGFIGGRDSRFGCCLSQRSKGIDGVVDSFQSCGLRADLARASRASSPRRADFWGAS